MKGFLRSTGIEPRTDRSPDQRCTHREPVSHEIHVVLKRSSLRFLVDVSNQSLNTKKKFHPSQKQFLSSLPLASDSWKSPAFGNEIIFSTWKNPNARDSLTPVRLPVFAERQTQRAVSYNGSDMADPVYFIVILVSKLKWKKKREIKCDG